MNQTRKSNKHRSTDRDSKKAAKGAARRAEIINANAPVMIAWKVAKLPTEDCAVCLVERAHPVGALFWPGSGSIPRNANLRYRDVDREQLSAFCEVWGDASAGAALSAPAPKGQVFLVAFAADGITVELRDESDVTNAVDGALVMVPSPAGSTPAAPVSQAALVARLKRKIAHDGLLLRLARGARERLDVGDYYTVDLYTHWVVDTHIDLEDLGRELGVLAANEKVA